MKDRPPNPSIPNAVVSSGSGKVSAVIDRPPSGPHVAIAVLGFTRDAVARDFLTEIAIEHGYGFRCASDGAEAMKVLDAEPPGLIVIDMDAPDGRALVRVLRADERWRGIPLVVLTATNNPMIAVTIDAPVFFKPDLHGLEDAVTGRFEPRAEEPSLSAPGWPRRPSDA